MFFEFVVRRPTRGYGDLLGLHIFHSSEGDGEFFVVLEIDSRGMIAKRNAQIQAQAPDEVYQFQGLRVGDRIHGVNGLVVANAEKITILDEFSDASVVYMIVEHITAKEPAIHSCERNHFVRPAMSTFVAYAERQFEDIDDISRQVLRIDANNLTQAVSYWDDWNSAPWTDDWSESFGDRLRGMLEGQLPTLMEETHAEIGKKYDPAHSSLLSSIASKSITGLKAFPRGPQKYQTYGDHLLAIMLKRIHKYCTETGLYHQNDLVYQGTPMWKVAEQNTIAHSLMCKKLKLLPSVHDVHDAGDLCEAMLLKLVEINQAHLAFLIASFIFCIAVDPHVRMTCT